LAINPTNNPAAVAEGRASSHIQEAQRQSGANVSAPVPVLEKVVVVEVLFDPSMIDDARAEFYVSNSRETLRDSSFLRSLPPNTIIGKKVRDGTSTGVEGLEYFFPFFPPHLMFPVKAGEHVWVFYENNKTNSYGYWWFRVNEPRNVDDLNHTHPDRKFQGAAVKGPREKAESPDDAVPGFGPAPTKRIGGQDIVQGTGTSYGTSEKAYDDLLTKSDAGKIHDFEGVPRFKKRPGDTAVQGSNNTLIVLGTDRTGAVADTTTDPIKGKVAKGKPAQDKKGNAGAIDIVVGRGQGDKTKPQEVVTNSLGNREVNKNIRKENPNEGDPDFDTDLGRVYLSMKTDVDGNFNINLDGVPQDNDEACAGVIKVDHLRIVARKTIKFLVQPTFDAAETDCAGIVIKANGDIVFVPSSKGIVKLGGDDADKALLGMNVGAANADGTVASAPIMSTLGGFLGVGSAHGVFCTKVMGR
jgi:hypothetical protein